MLVCVIVCLCSFIPSFVVRWVNTCGCFFVCFLQAAKEAENLVIQKMRCQDYVILCVEDTTDWKHATTRNVVTQVRTALSVSLFLVMVVVVVVVMPLSMLVVVMVVVVVVVVSSFFLPIRLVCDSDYPGICKYHISVVSSVIHASSMFNLSFLPCCLFSVG